MARLWQRRLRRGGIRRVHLTPDTMSKRHVASIFQGSRRRAVLVDVDTQNDLLFNDGRDRGKLLRNTRRLMAWARVHHITVVSTTLTHRPGASNDLPGAPSICLEGTMGQQKIRCTVLPSSIQFGPENRFDLPRHLLTDYQQIIFEKRSSDPFSQPRADRLLTEMKADEFVVFGTGTDNAVKATVLGLLYRHKKVTVVTDAVDVTNARNAIMALRQMEAKGARLATTESLTGASKLIGKAPGPNPAGVSGAAHMR